MDEIFWGVGSDAVEQSRGKANKVARGDGNLALEADPRIPPNHSIYGHNVTIGQFTSLQGLLLFLVSFFKQMP